MKRILWMIALLSLAVLLFACGDAAHTSQEYTTAAPATATPTESDTTASKGGETPLSSTAPAAKETTAEVTFADVLYDTTPLTGEDGTPYLINWNPYLLSPVAEDAYEDAFHAAIKAILNHRKTVIFSTLDELKAVRDNLFYEFPPSALCTWTADEKSLSLRFTYTYERSEHLEKLASFGDTVEDIIQKSLLFGDGEAEKAILLYHEIAYTVDYFQVDYTKAETNAYTALTEKKAICYSFSDAYNYLLRQVGVRAYLVKGYRSGDRAAHGWSLVEIDGRYYHCDATWEYSMLDGIGLYYFAMSDSRRQKNVVLAEATVGEGILKNKLTLKADSDRFTGINGDKFREKTWTLDREKEAIVYRGREYSYQAQ